MATNTETLVLTQEERMSIDNMAAVMFTERVAEDTAKGRNEIYAANPDARQLYFKGMHDTLVALSEWADEGITPELMATFTQAMHDQTCEDLQPGGTATH